VNTTSSGIIVSSHDLARAVYTLGR
jgi:hypothetical protein